MLGPVIFSGFEPASPPTSRKHRRGKTAGATKESCVGGVKLSYPNPGAGKDVGSDTVESSFELGLEVQRSDAVRKHRRRPRKGSARSQASCHLLRAEAVGKNQAAGFAGSELAMRAIWPVCRAFWNQRKRERSRAARAAQW